jgi:hypothetical protein
MSDEIQAKADLPEDAATVSDPLDPENSTESGTSELADFEQEMLTMSDDPAEAVTQGDTPAEPETTEEAAEEEPPDETQETPEEESSETEEGEPEEEPANTSNRYRIRAKDDVEAEALALRKRHPDWSLEKCIASAKDLLGVKPAESPEDGSTQAPVETSASVDAQLKELRAKHKEATTALEFETAAEIFEQIEALRDKQVELRFSEVQEKSRAEMQKAQEFDEKWDAAAQRAATFYPDSAKPDSAMARKIAELDQRMKDLGDDLYFDPEKPFILAREAAKELKIPMRDPKAKPAAKPSPASPIQPASGNARTAPVNPAKRMSEELDALDSLDAFEAHVGSMSFG